MIEKIKKEAISAIGSKMTDERGTEWIFSVLETENVFIDCNQKTVVIKGYYCNHYTRTREQYFFYNFETGACFTR